MNLNTEEDRDLEFDGLKALAVLAVVGCHLSKLCMHWQLTNDDFWEGACGAHLLLIASGFGMSWALPQVGTLREFCVDRFSRVYPLYAFAIVLGTTLIAFTAPPLYEITAAQFLANLTMCQSWLGQPEIDGAFWVTGVLLKFTVLLAAVVLLRGQTAIERLSLVYLAGIVILKATPIGLAIPDRIQGIVNINHAHLLIAGSLLCTISKKGNSIARSTAFSICVWLEIMATRAPLGSLVIVGVMTVCYFRGYLHFLRHFANLGRRYSFAIYMLHGVTGYVAMNVVSEYTSSIWVLMLCGLAATLVAAKLARCFVEVPCRQWLHSFFHDDGMYHAAMGREQAWSPSWFHGKRDRFVD